VDDWREDGRKIYKQEGWHIYWEREGSCMIYRMDD